MTICAWRTHGARSNNRVAPEDLEGSREDRERNPVTRLHQGCVGCENQGRPGRSGTASALHERRGNRRGRSPRRGAATALEWRAVWPEPRAVVRSTLPKAEARSPTSAARSVSARRLRRCGGRRGRTLPPRRRPGSGGELSEPPGKRSAQ